MKKLFPILLFAIGSVCATQMANAKIISVDQLYGNYNAVYTWGITNDKTGQLEGAPDFLINPVIEAGSEANQIRIKGLFPTMGEEFPQNATTPIVGAVDLQAQTVTVMSGQSLGSDRFGSNSLFIQKFDLNTGTFSNVSSVTATINEKGDICFPTEYSICCKSTDNSFWYVFFTLTLQPYSGSYLHEASYYAGTYNTSFSWYDGDQFANSTNVSINPVFVAKGDYGIDIKNLYGYLYDGIVIAAEVLPSGDLKIDNMQTWDYRNTGYQLFMFDSDFNMPDYMIASLDAQGSLVLPKGSTFAMGIYPNLGNLIAVYGYKDLVMTNESGVESISLDIENGQAKYFNIQGQPVLNPQKGQIVIKRVNGKSSKIMVK